MNAELCKILIVIISYKCYDLVQDYKSRSQVPFEADCVFCRKGPHQSGQTFLLSCINTQLYKVCTCSHVCACMQILIPNAGHEKQLIRSGIVFCIPPSFFSCDCRECWICATHVSLPFSPSFLLSHSCKESIEKRNQHEYWAKLNCQLFYSFSTPFLFKFVSIHFCFGALSSCEPVHNICSSVPFSLHFCYLSNLNKVSPSQMAKWSSETRREHSGT